MTVLASLMIITHQIQHLNELIVNILTLLSGSYRSEEGRWRPGVEPRDEPGSQGEVAALFKILASMSSRSIASWPGSLESWPSTQFYSQPWKKKTAWKAWVRDWFPGSLLEKWKIGESLGVPIIKCPWMSDFAELIWAPCLMFVSFKVSDIFLFIQFPSMVERIQFQLMDWSVTCTVVGSDELELASNS